MEKLIIIEQLLAFFLESSCNGEHFNQCCYRSRFFKQNCVVVLVIIVVVFVVVVVVVVVVGGEVVVVVIVVGGAVVVQLTPDWVASGTW